MAEKKRLTISLDPIDYAKLEELAIEGERSLSWLIGQAVKCYVEAAKTSESGRLPRQHQTRLIL